MRNPKVLKNQNKLAWKLAWEGWVGYNTLHLIDG